MRFLGIAAKARGPLSLLLCALSTSACGQASGRRLGGTNELPPDPADWRVGTCGIDAAHLELIEDMEDGDIHILVVAGRGESNGWFAFNDETKDPDGVQDPHMHMSKIEWSKLASPRGRSQVAARTVGSGFVTWGAGIGFDFAANKSYDASRYAGIAFWARAGAEGDPNLRVRMNVNDRNTSAVEAICDADCPSVNMNLYEDGVCDKSRRPCFDDFGVDLEHPVNAEWQFFHYEWSELTTVNWSMQNLSRLVTEELYGLRFQTAEKQSFELFIDDVSFLCPQIQ